MPPNPAPSGLSLRAWRTLRKELIWIYQGAPGQQSGIAYKRSNTSLAWLVLRGHVSIESGRQRITARTGDWLLPSPDERLQFVSPRARLLSVKFTAAWPDGRNLYEYTPGLRFKAATFPALEIAARQLKRHLGDLLPIDQATPIQDIQPYLTTRLVPPTLLSKTDELMSAWLSTFADTMEAIGQAPTPMEGPDERVVRAVEAIQHHPTDEVFQEKKIARAAGLSVPHLIRLFRQRFGRSPLQYYQIERLAHAKHLLHTTGLPVKQIAYDLGFHSASHFCRWFHDRTSTTPLTYRRDETRHGRSF